MIATLESRTSRRLLHRCSDLRLHLPEQLATGFGGGFETVFSQREHLVALELVNHLVEGLLEPIRLPPCGTIGA
jgi:hypothetical protein